MIDVGFAELHDTVFVGNKNMPHKLDTHHLKGLRLAYDREEKELHVTWNNVTAIIPSTNIKSYIPGVAQDRHIQQAAAPHVMGSSFSAQVESPMSHVHAGPGRGKTGKSK